MKRVDHRPDWPDSWIISYQHDLDEIYGAKLNLGYTYAYTNRSEWAIQAVSTVCPRGGTILDVAAAQGNFSLTLAESGFDVTWNDFRHELVGYVQLKHEFGRVDFRPGNILEARFGPIFDVVLMTEIVEHVAHPDRLLEHAAGFLKERGHIVLTTPSGEYFLNRLPRFSDFADTSVFESAQFRPDSDGHIFLLHEDEVRALAWRSGLEVIEFQRFTNVLTQGHVGTHHLLPFIPAAIVWKLEITSRRLPCALSRRILAHTGAVLRRR